MTPEQARLLITEIERRKAREYITLAGVMRVAVLGDKDAFIQMLAKLDTDVEGEVSANDIDRVSARMQEKGFAVEIMTPDQLAAIRGKS